MHGPPGTGKSQTIANLIADTLGRGQTVLFVSAKMAALQVVYDRLVDRGFGRFCLEAHSTRAGKARIVDELKRALEAAGHANGGDPTAEINRYTHIRESLNEAVRELHARRQPLGITVYEALGHFASLRELPEVPAALPWPDPTSVSREALEAVLDVVADLQAEAGTFAVRATHPWRGCQVADASLATTDRLVGALGTVRAACEVAFGVEADLAPFLGVLRCRSVEEVRRAQEALAVLAEASWLPPAWTTEPVATLDERATALQDAVARVDALMTLRDRFAAQVEEVVDPVAIRETLAPALTRFAPFYTRWLPAYGAWKKEVRGRPSP